MSVPVVDIYLCNGCGSCAALYPEVFEMGNDKAWVKSFEAAYGLKAEELISCCPQMAISFD